MNRLRESPDDFVALIGAAADHFAMPDPAFVEKDYWVVEVLRSLVVPLDLEPIDGKKCAAQIVFKGGTSLSKAFALIDRFSEDVDVLVVCENLGANAREKRVLRPLCDRAANDVGLSDEFVIRHDYKAGFTRNVTFNYAVLHVAAGLKQGVKLEMGIRGGVLPGLLRRGVRSFIAEYLEAIGEGAPYDECATVEVDVLHPVRTLAEKLSFLHHAASTAAEGNEQALCCGRPSRLRRAQSAALRSRCAGVARRPDG